MRSYRENTLLVHHTQVWVYVSLEFPINEFRAGWKIGGEALVQRLEDKNYSWKVVPSLIPQMIVTGLSDYIPTSVLI